MPDLLRAGNGRAILRLRARGGVRRVREAGQCVSGLQERGPGCGPDLEDLRRTGRSETAVAAERGHNQNRAKEACGRWRGWRGVDDE